MSTLSPVEVLRLLIEEEIERVEFRPYVLLSNIRKEDEYQSKIDWNVTLGGGQISGRAVTEDVGAADTTDTAKNAQLSIGDRVLGHNFALLRTKIEEAKKAGVGALRNLLMEHVERAFEIIYVELSTKLYTGTGNSASHGIIGLNSVVTATSYAGIDSGTYPEWLSTVQANSGTNRTLTKGLLDGMDTALKRRGVSYNVIYTTPEMIKKYEDLFNSERSLTVNQLNGIADIGFSGHAYRRVPIIEDTQAPNNTLLFMDFPKLKLKTYYLGDVVKDGRVIGATTKLEKMMGMNVRIAELTNRNPDLLEMEISVLPQLQVRQPKMVAALKDITQ
jgi:hypothetical protein